MTQSKHRQSSSRTRRALKPLSSTNVSGKASVPKSAAGKAQRRPLGAKTNLSAPLRAREQAPPSPASAHTAVELLDVDAAAATAVTRTFTDSSATTTSAEREAASRRKSSSKRVRISLDRRRSSLPDTNTNTNDDDDDDDAGTSAISWAAYRAAHRLSLDRMSSSSRRARLSAASSARSSVVPDDYLNDTLDDDDGDEHAVHAARETPSRVESAFTDLSSVIDGLAAVESDREQEREHLREFSFERNDALSFSSVVLDRLSYGSTTVEDDVDEEEAVAVAAANVNDEKLVASERDINEMDATRGGGEIEASARWQTLELLCAEFRAADEQLERSRAPAVPGRACTLPNRREERLRVASEQLARPRAETPAAGRRLSPRPSSMPPQTHELASLVHHLLAAENEAATAALEAAAEPVSTPIETLAEETTTTTTLPNDVSVQTLCSRDLARARELDEVYAGRGRRHPRAAAYRVASLKQFATPTAFVPCGPGSGAWADTRAPLQGAGPPPTPSAFGTLASRRHSRSLSATVKRRSRIASWTYGPPPPPLLPSREDARLSLDAQLASRRELTPPRFAPSLFSSWFSRAWSRLSRRRRNNQDPQAQVQDDYDAVWL